MIMHLELFRLISHHQDILYYDERSNHICYGPVVSSQKNLLLSLCKNQGLLHVIASKISEFCHIDDVYDHKTIHLRSDNGPANLVVNDAGDGLVSISFKGKFLSRGLDGNAKFDSHVCQNSGRFQRISVEPVLDQLDIQQKSDVFFPSSGDDTSGLNFTLFGPFGSNWSLASVNRRLAIELDQIYPKACRIVSDNMIIDSVPQAYAEKLAELFARLQAISGTNVVIHQRWPVSAPDVRGDITLAYFFWEESRVPSETVLALNAFDAVLVSADFVGDALVASGLTCPVLTIGYSPDLKPFEALYRPTALLRTQPLTFLHVSSSEHRKGLDVLLLAYARSFSASDEVRLIIKGQRVLAQPYIDQVRSTYPDMAEIVLLDEQLDVDSLVELYRSADIMVLPTRGEGFNLPAAEAIAAGLQLIVTGYGGQMQFCQAGVARLVKYELVQSLSVFSQPNSLWAEPDLDDLCYAMLEAKAGLIQINPAIRADVMAKLSGRIWIEQLTEKIGVLLNASV